MYAHEEANIKLMEHVGKHVILRDWKNPSFSRKGI
jgi:hypothetical protein